MLLALVTLLQDSLLIPKADTVTNAANAAAAGANPHIQLLGLLMKGGVLMIPLGVLSLIAVYVFVERYITIARAGRIEENFMPMIRDHITSGNIAAARSLSKNTPNPI